MSSDIDADLFAFLYTIAAGVHTLQGRIGPDLTAPSEADAAGDDGEPRRFRRYPTCRELASVLDQVNEQLDAAEARVLDLGQELAEHVPSVEAKRATHDAVQNLLDRLGDVREAVEELRSFDYREGPLREFLAGQRRTLTKVPQDDRRHGRRSRSGPRLSREHDAPPAPLGRCPPARADAAGGMASLAPKAALVAAGMLCVVVARRRRPGCSTRRAMTSIAVATRSRTRRSRSHSKRSSTARPPGTSEPRRPTSPPPKTTCARHCSPPAAICRSSAANSARCRELPAPSSDLLADGAELSEELGRIDTSTAAGRLAALEVLSTRRAVDFDAAIASADLGPRKRPGWRPAVDAQRGRGATSKSCATTSTRCRVPAVDFRRSPAARRGSSCSPTSNAEMRIGQGAALQYGVIEVADGSIRTSSFDRVGALGALPSGLRRSRRRRELGVGGPPNLAFVGLTPRFDAVARNAAGMVSQVTGQPFDAVIQLDSVAITELVSLTGPVDTVGRRPEGLRARSTMRSSGICSTASTSASRPRRSTRIARTPSVARRCPVMAAEAISRIDMAESDIGRTARGLRRHGPGTPSPGVLGAAEIQAAFEALGAGHRASRPTCSRLRCSTPAPTNSIRS